MQDSEKIESGPTREDEANARGVSFWLPIGLCFGVVFGVVTDNIGLGVALGVCLGVAVGSTAKSK